ncbi:hypothetical protein VPH35_001904 [Triticum aestivum]
MTPPWSADAVADDPIAGFFANEVNAVPPPKGVDYMLVELDAQVAAAMEAPLSFNKQLEQAGPLPSGPLDAFGPTLAGPPVIVGLQHQQAPSRPKELAVQLGAITQQVRQLQLVPEESVLLPSPGPVVTSAPSSLFQQGQPPILMSARQAANHSEVPVAQRAALPLVHALGILGPREKMTPNGVVALIKKFKKPLSEEDINAIATLTRLDHVALRIAAGMAGPDAAASVATS